MNKNIQLFSITVLMTAAGFAVGMALQGTLGNFAAGVMLLIFRPFKVGDYVEAAGTAGTVTELAVFATVLKTPDNKKIIIPNSSITDGNIVNFSAHPTRRVDMVMGDEREWGLGFALDPDGFGMGGLGGSVGWWSEVGQYAFGFATAEIAGYDRSERLENAVRGCLDLPAL